MVEGTQGWIESNPLITAIALCYLLTFISVRQIKPILPHFEVNVKWLPKEFRKRLILRMAVFVCGVVVSVIVASGLAIFQLVPLTFAKAFYIAVSVGFLAPFVYDALFAALKIMEFIGIVKPGLASKVKGLIDPTKVEVVLNDVGEPEKMRYDDKTVWRKPPEATHGKRPGRRRAPIR